jgi:arabinogalactan oligomer / maltooligosaccharide transport system permease protein
VSDLPQSKPLTTSTVRVRKQYWNTMTAQRRLTLIFRVIVGILAIAFAIFPAIWIISAAFDPSGSLATTQIIPRNASLRNFDRLLTNPINPYLVWLWNSIKISTIVSGVSVIILAASAYAFSRFRFQYRQHLLLGIFLVSVFPNSLALVGLFLLVLTIGVYVPFLGLNSHGGLILAYLGWVMGINVWLTKGFFDSVPRDIDESAMVDGASHFQIFRFLILPLVRPILAVVGILSFIGTFNDFLIARALLQSTNQFTLMVGMYLFVDQQFAQNWGVFAAGALIASVPIVFVYLLLQDQIVSGLTTGSVKG